MELKRIIRLNFGSQMAVVRVLSYPSSDVLKSSSLCHQYFLPQTRRFLLPASCRVMVLFFISYTLYTNFSIKKYFTFLILIGTVNLQSISLIEIYTWSEEIWASVVHICKIMQYDWKLSVLTLETANCSCVTKDEGVFEVYWASFQFQGNIITAGC